MTSSLPQNWETWLLADVGEWSGGGTPTSTEDAFWGGDIPWVTPKDMKLRHLVSSQDTITPAAVENSAAKMIDAGSVLFVTRSGILAHSFPVATIGVTSTINQDLKAITPFEVIDVEYLGWALRALSRKILKSCSKHGTTVHSIEVPTLKGFGIPVPPLNEQRRIVAKIEELIVLLEKSAESLILAREQLHACRYSVLKRAFEGRLVPRDSTDESASILIERIAEKQMANRRKLPPNKKSTDRASAAVTSDEGVADHWQPVVAAIPAHWAYVDFEDGFENVSTSKIKVPETHYAVSGRFPIIDQGKSLVGGYTDDESKVINKAGSAIVFGDHTRCFKLVDFPFAPGADGTKVLKASECLDPKFAYYGCLSIRLPDRGYSRHYSFLKKAKFPVAPLKEQQRIVSKIEEIFSAQEKMGEDIEVALARITSLRQAILNRAFTGRLIPQNLNDEPASISLKRIRGEREEGITTKRRNNKNGKKEAA